MFSFRYFLAFSKSNFLVSSQILSTGIFNIILGVLKLSQTSSKP